MGVQYKYSRNLFFGRISGSVAWSQSSYNYVKTTLQQAAVKNTHFRKMSSSIIVATIDHGLVDYKCGFLLWWPVGCWLAKEKDFVTVMKMKGLGKFPICFGILFEKIVQSPKLGIDSLDSENLIPIKWLWSNDPWFLMDIFCIHERNLCLFLWLHQSITRLARVLFYLPGRPTFRSMYIYIYMYIVKVLNEQIREQICPFWLFDLDDVKITVQKFRLSWSHGSFCLCEHTVSVLTPIPHNTTKSLAAVEYGYWTEPKKASQMPSTFKGTVAWDFCACFLGCMDISRP